MTIPRLLIGATRSGEGKTTVSLGIMAALRARGLRVQGFKVGPDYLDTGYQLLATGQAGRNLDLWMMGENAVRQSLLTHGGAADISVIEGVMGLFDGHRDGVTPTSSAEVAKSLSAPVILVIDAAHLAASAGAIALGFHTFDPNLRIAGVIFNRWNPLRAKDAMGRALAHAGIPILGYLPAQTELSLPSRHLGLVIAEEMKDEVSTLLTRLATTIEEYVDVDQLLALATAALPLPAMPECPTLTSAGAGVRVAVARDKAFAFYYPENWELLTQTGAEICFFSPVHDAELPNVDGIYLGGGYPELYARQLAKNSSMRASILTACQRGMPVYAECGGLLYLATSLTTLEGDCWPMVGAVPARTRMHSTLQRMGYRTGIMQQPGILGAVGTAVRGHEFHYSSIEFSGEPPHAYLLDGRAEGYSSGNVFASYQHLHFAGCPAVVSHFLSACSRYQQQRGSL